MPTSMEKDTYPGHILVADGLSFGAVILGIKTDSPQLAAAGFVGYFVGGPMVHLAHGRGATAGASVGLRVLTPLAGGIVGAGIATVASGDRGCRSDGEFCIPPSLVGGVIGGFLGVIAAPILDASLLARKEWLNGLSVVPTVAFQKGGGTFALAGAFLSRSVRRIRGRRSTPRRVRLRDPLERTGPSAKRQLRPRRGP